MYDAARSYLEIPQRINLLNTRVAVRACALSLLCTFPLTCIQVLQDMLQLLKETVSSRHAERLEQIVIALIVVEISSVHLLHLADISSPYFYSTWHHDYYCGPSGVVEPFNVVISNAIGWSL